jgi:hypothetical protein
MTNRCGSTDPMHVARRCRQCKSIYNRSYRLARKAQYQLRPVGVRLELNPAVCAFCGLARGNSQRIPVYRYPLERTIYPNGVKRTASIASIGLCDECLIQNTQPSPSYMRAHGLSRREWPAKRAA